MDLTAPEKLKTAHDVSGFDCGEKPINDNGAIHRSSVVPKARQRNSPIQHPVTILARMGVSIDAQAQGIAVDMLQDAIERALAASAVIGSTAMIVHPLNERLESSTQKCTFYSLPRHIPDDDDASTHLIGIISPVIAWANNGFKTVLLARRT